MMSDGSVSPQPTDRWNSGASYEPYVGRWSRLVAREFLGWLDLPPRLRWLDVGSGTGALSETILKTADPAEIKGIEPSEAFRSFALEHVVDGRVRFEAGNAQALPVESASYDAVVAGLVLNFVPDQPAALREMTRAAKPDGVVAAYVWDYADKMQMMRYFWDAATALIPAAAAHDEATRFPICHPEPLAALFQSSGLERVDVRSIDISTRFRDFDDYWTPFLGGTGSAPTFIASLSEPERVNLRDYLQAHLPINADGSITLVARAWAVRGYRP
jgi:SAM-dependent methyltransferase